MINPTKTLLSQKINRIDMKITQAEQSRRTRMHVIIYISILN
jgi:hypothetical protein